MPTLVDLRRAHDRQFGLVPAEKGRQVAGSSLEPPRSIDSRHH
jgi:hypothetical protein